MDERFETALKAYQQCGKADDWPHAIGTLLLARLESGDEVVWPIAPDAEGGECFYVVRVRDRRVLTEDEFPSEMAHALPWETHEFKPALRW